MLKDFVKTNDWQEISLMFYEEMENMMKTIPYNDKELAVVGQHYVARQEAIGIIKKVLKRIENKSRDNEIKKESYR